MARAQGKVGFTTTRAAHGRGRSRAKASALEEGATFNCCPRDGLPSSGRARIRGDEAS